MYLGLEVKAIGKNAFRKNKNISKVVIGNNVEYIGKYAFGNCVNLETVIISRSVTKIDECAFIGCEKLKNLIIPKTVEIIGQRAFGVLPYPVYCEHNNRPVGWDYRWTGVYYTKCYWAYEWEMVNGIPTPKQ